MKRFVLWLCILAVLICALTFVGCTDDEQPDTEEPAGDTTPSGGDGDGSTNGGETPDTQLPDDVKPKPDEDTAADIFGNDPAGNDVFPE
ncbi:MAG: hypothetical protein IJY50_08790 [Clostridia bacterium]|nr:hypothetical protein [Clostridia bacterium]